MKANISFILFIPFCLILSCASSPKIDPQDLIGTKWLSVGKNIISGKTVETTLEFIDETHCIQNYIGIISSIRYKIDRDSIIFYHSIGNMIYVLKDDIMYYNGKPTYNKIQ